MNNFRISINILFLALYAVRSINGEIFEECNGVEDETFVASWSDCKTYIYCSGDDSVSGECDDGEYFDGESQSCDAAENVYCQFDEPSQPDPDPEPITTTTTVATTTTTRASTSAASSTTTATTVMPATASTSAGTSTDSPIDSLHIPSVVRASCPPLDEPNQIVLVPNRQSCSDYYLCYHGQPIDMHCTNHLHFNIHTGKCDFPEMVQCMIDRPNANKCLPHITDFFPHPEKCNYFYYCIRGFLTVQQCPFYYGWDIEKRACVQMSQAKCYNNMIY